MKVATNIDDRGRRALPLLAWLAAGLMSALLLAGCGNLPAGSATGETTVYVVGDGDEPVASPVSSGTSLDPRTSESTAPSSSDPMWAGADLATASAAEEPEGEIELEFDLELVRSDGTTVALTDQEAQVEVELPGGPGTEIRVATRVVDAGQYATLRVNFDEIDVWIDQGLIIDGIEVMGLIDVEMEDPNLVVDRTIDLIVEQGANAELLVDMNAAAWLESEDALDKIIDGTLVAESIEVRVR